jgi:carboxymethylenebutenolidase
VIVPSRGVLRGFAETTVPVGTSGDSCLLFTLAPAGSPPWPAVMILHSAFGIGDHIRAVAQKFAAQGYLAAVPDLYCNDADYANHTWRHIEAAAHVRAGEEAFAEFDAAEHERIEAAGAWLARRNSRVSATYVRACFDALRQNPQVSRIGCLGYCMGGRFAGGLAAEGVDLSAAVVFYGGPPPLDSVHRIRCPIEGHYAAHDHAITDKVPAFEAAMKQAGKEFHACVYDAPHGFVSTERLQPKYVAEGREAMARAHSFLRLHLKPITQTA